MRGETNSLDLNTLPTDHTAKQPSAGCSFSDGRNRKKKSGGNEEKDEGRKEYECRFCSLKFPKSQALGGHMNRHRQERETETLIKARDLVFSNHFGPPTHISYFSSGPAGGYQYHQASHYPSRMFPAPPQTAPYAFPSPTIRSQYPAAPPPSGNYYTCIGAPVSGGAARGPEGGGGGDPNLQNEEGLDWGRR